MRRERRDAIFRVSELLYLSLQSRTPYSRSLKDALGQLYHIQGQSRVQKLLDYEQLAGDLKVLFNRIEVAAHDFQVSSLVHHSITVC